MEQPLPLTSLDQVSVETKLYVFRKYYEILGRKADEEGFQFFCLHVANGNLTEQTFEQTLRDSEEYRALSPEKRERFLTITLDVTNKCNLQCIMCYQSTDESLQMPHIKMKLSDFHKIADELFPRAISVCLSCGSEPLIHKEFYKFLEILGPYRIPQLSLVTNGLLIQDELMKVIISSGMNQLAISIDGLSKDTYEKIRVPAKFEKLIEKLELISRVKREMNSEKPRLRLNFTMMRSNVEDLWDLILFCQKHGFSLVDLRHVVQFEELPLNEGESLIYQKERSNEILAFVDQEARKYGIDMIMPPLFDLSEKPDQARTLTNKLKQEKRPLCEMPFSFINFGSDGSVLPCCYWYNDHPMGNLLQQSFEQIWNNERYRHLREKLASHDLSGLPCYTCPAMKSGLVDDEKSFAINRLYHE